MQIVDTLRHVKVRGAVWVCAHNRYAVVRPVSVGVRKKTRVDSDSQSRWCVLYICDGL